jgi:hypothetical protein
LSALLANLKSATSTITFTVTTSATKLAPVSTSGQITLTATAAKTAAHVSSATSTVTFTAKPQGYGKAHDTFTLSSSAGKFNFAALSAHDTFSLHAKATNYGRFVDTITLTTKATKHIGWPVAAVGAITLSAKAKGYGIAKNTITFTGTAVAHDQWVVAATSTITLTAAASNHAARAERTLDAFTLTDSASFKTAWPKAATDTITLHATASQNVKWPVASTGAITLSATASQVFTRPAATTGAITFTGTATSTGKWAKSTVDTINFASRQLLSPKVNRSDTITFTGVASSSHFSAAGASDTVTLFARATQHGVRVIATDLFTLTDPIGTNAVRRNFLPQPVTDTITFHATAVSDHTVFPVKVDPPDVILFTEFADENVLTPQEARQGILFFDFSAGILTKLNASSSSGILFSDKAVLSNVLFVSQKSAADTIILSALADETQKSPSTARDSILFIGAAREHTGYPAARSDTITFSSVADSNDFSSALASDRFTFSDAATHAVLPLGSHDTIFFSDRSSASDRLPSGITLPTGDINSGLQHVLFAPVSLAPLTYAESPDGVLYMANGMDPVIGWDGVADQAWAAGVVPPNTIVFVDPGDPGGLLTGIRYAFVRFVDVRGNLSNLSPISDPVNLGTDGIINGVTYDTNGVVTVLSYAHGLTTGATVVIQDVTGLPIVNGTFTIVVVDANSFTLNALVITSGTYQSGGTWTHGSKFIQYSNVQVPTDPKIVRRQILRNLEGTAKVFYVDVDTSDLTSTSFQSALTDEQLATKTAVPLQFEDKEPASQRYYPPPSHKKAIAAYAGRLWLTADMIYSQGNVQVAFGNQVVVGIGTAWTASMAGRLLYVGGASQYQIILSVNVATQMLILQAPYQGPSNPMAFYSIRPAPIERRLVYYSEPNAPEAWPPWNAFAIPESSDEIVGLFIQRSFLYVLKERHIYKFAYREDPGVDGFVFPVASRGCVSDRCYAYVEGRHILLDEMGIYAFDGDAIDPVSAPVQVLFKSDDSSPYRVDWTTDRTLWSCTHDPNRTTVRWILDLVGKAPLSHAVCWDYRSNQWWLEQYAEPISSSCSGVVDGFQQSLVGITARRVFALGQGSTDVVPELSSGTLRGSVSAADPVTITDPLARFASNLAGVPVSIVSGTGAGQQAIISSNTSDVLTLVHPWDVVPDTTSVYQIGGVNWTWKSGWRRIVDDESDNPRDLEWVFQPTLSESTFSANVFYDHNVNPESWASYFDDDGVAVAAGQPSLVVDVSSPRGYAIQRMSGHRDPYGYGHRYLATQLNGVQGAEPHRLYQLVLNGVE